MKRTTVDAMKRALAAIVAVFTAMTFSAATASAEPERKTLVFKSEVTLPAAPIARAPHIAGVATDPPMGGCEAKVQFSTTAYYEDLYLVDTVTDYYADLVCTTTGPGQVMEHISVVAELLVDDDIISREGPNDCVNCTSMWATRAKAPCFQGARKCWGTYTARNTVTMLLPDGWYWPSKPWPTCDLFGGEYPPEAHCTVTSSPAEFPLVL
jgi:hypothetical protein